MRLVYIALFVSSLSFSQHQKKGVVYDKENNEPLEFVSVYNKLDHTTTNKDGKYGFTSATDSIYFHKVGYDNYTTIISNLRDTIFLNRSVFQLNEVVVSNAKTIYQKIKDSIASNYVLKPHSEAFFLRAILKRNGAIIRLQDMQGNLHRKTSIYGGGLTLMDTDFSVAVKNMRQIGITKDENNIYFEFPSLFNILSEFVRINAMGPDFEVIEKPYKNSTSTKVEFTSLNSDTKNKSYGHYIINTNDNAILSFNSVVKPFYPEELFKTPKYSTIVQQDITVFFKEDPSFKRYFMTLAKRTATLNVKLKDDPTVHKFEMEIVLYTKESFGNEDVKSNVNEQKDIFKIKMKYDKDFWKEQNQLLLTDEMEAFIKKMTQDDTKRKVKSNIKD
ncbi:carboxypeptidase-like regulatory domain-containing protein [Cellulophaga sp. Z1A5H]|uniref:carboxypeptidase-like regulatory domain-containing protein n=1 Tax=Cellulophaga sp. Z1A5H TaxID=2687291 RepID=UPI0013FE144D|nr:carboxypeptidase-like regulatory domain-containing protein [Cellulophaga sp. Z1A5H]